MVALAAGVASAPVTPAIADALYVADQNAGTIWPPGAVLKVDLESGEQRVFADSGLLQRPGAITRGVDLALYVVQETFEEFPQMSILRIDPVTGAQSLVTNGGLLQTPSQIAAAPTGALYVSDGQDPGVRDDGAIIRVDPLTGEQSFVTRGGLVKFPTDLTFTPSGQLLVLDNGNSVGSVVRVDPNSGNQTLITTYDDLQDHVLRAALTIAAPNDDVAYVCDNDQLRARVWRVQLGTGRVSLVSELGAEVYEPRDALIDESGSLLVLILHTSGRGGHVVRVDPNTGAQATAVFFKVAQTPLAMVFGPDIPTPARLPSWGALKARYR